MYSTNTIATLKEVINRNADAIGEIMADAIKRKREGNNDAEQ